MDIVPSGFSFDPAIIIPDYSIFENNAPGTKLTRGRLKSMLDAGQNVTTEDLLQRQAELSTFFEKAAKLMISRNIVRAKDSYMAIKAPKDNIRDVEWYKDVLAELEQNETAEMARLERVWAIKQKSADIMYTGSVEQVRKIFEVSDEISAYQYFEHRLTPT